MRRFAISRIRARVLGFTPLLLKARDTVAYETLACLAISLIVTLISCSRMVHSLANVYRVVKAPLERRGSNVVIR